MPDIPATVESLKAHPQRGGFRAAALAIPLALLSQLSGAAPAEDKLAPTLHAASPHSATLEAYLTAFLSLDRHEIAALALTLGILCFAVVTAIMLVRTRARLAETEALARDERLAARASVDRAYALLLAEPQILIAWAAGSNEPEIIGDPALVTGQDEPHRVLAF